MEQKQFIQLEEQYGAHNYKPLDVVLSRGEGVWVWDVHRCSRVQYSGPKTWVFSNAEVLTIAIFP